MVKEKKDKRKYPTKRVFCKDCNREIAITAFKNHHCVGGKWYSIEGNKEKYQDVIKHNSGVTQIDKTTTEQIEDIPESSTKQWDKTTDEQVTEQNEQQQITQIQIEPEEDKMTEEIKNEEKPEKKEDKEMTYECGECHHQFNNKVKYCPECGVQFD